MNAIPVRDADDLEKKRYKWYKRGFTSFSVMLPCQCNEFRPGLLVTKNDMIVLKYFACQDCYESHRDEFCEYEPDKTEAP